MAASWSGSVAAFLAADAGILVGQVVDAVGAGRGGDADARIRRCAASVAALRVALRGWPDAARTALALDHAVPRLAGRIDAVLALRGAIAVLAFRDGPQPFGAGHRRQVEDHALDLQDFHAGCAGRPVVPLLVGLHAAPGQVPAQTAPLMLAGAHAVLCTTASLLGATLRRLADAADTVPALRTQPAADWDAMPYRPVPGLIEAARIAYARHGVTEIAAARADTAGLTATLDAIAAAARGGGRPTAVFVTGLPGAGKTLCGLHAAFGPMRDGAVYLTGNPTLVTVLREALVRDAVKQGRDRAAACQRIAAMIQPLPLFRDHYVAATAQPPAERIAILDEAQRCWTRDYAIRKGRDRPVALTDSEPGHVLDIMARHPGGGVLVCLCGGGQEIHAGEGGLAEWGAALALRPAWRVIAPPQALHPADPRQRLPPLPGVADRPIWEL